MTATAKQYRHHVRHWREKWDPNAELVFTRRMKLGIDPKNPWVNPGDPVTQTIRERLGVRKLMTWWRARAVGLKEWLITRDVVVEVQESSIVAIGGGWFRVMTTDGKEHRIRGKEEAEALLERLNRGDATNSDCCERTGTVLGSVDQEDHP